MKRRSSVFNNYNSNKYSSASKKNRNGILNTQSEFASDFFIEDSNNECEEVRKTNKSESNKGKKNNSKA